VVVEDQYFIDTDLVKVGGAATAFTIEVAKVVDDGFVSIQTIDRINKAKLSGIEIILKEVHTAHAVSQGPYTVVDKDNNGSEVVSVDSCKIHIHRILHTALYWLHDAYSHSYYFCF